MTVDLEIKPLKDEENELAVSTYWRPVLTEIVSSFSAKDYLLSKGIEGVQPISEQTAQQIREYIEDYGESLAELPSETWSSSCSIWNGAKWEVIVDLWTEESGRSDMILHVEISESGYGYLYEVYMVYVP